MSDPNRYPNAFVMVSTCFRWTRPFSTYASTINPAASRGIEPDQDFEQSKPWLREEHGIKSFIFLVALAIGDETFVACQLSNQHQACAGCDQAKTGWCDHCGVGYKADGTTTKSCYSGATG